MRYLPTLCSIVIATSACGCGGSQPPGSQSTEVGFSSRTPLETKRLHNVAGIAWLVKLIEEYDERHGQLPIVCDVSSTVVGPRGWQYELLRSNAEASLSKLETVSREYALFAEFIGLREPWNSHRTIEMMRQLNSIPWCESWFPYLDKIHKPCRVLAVTGSGSAFDHTKSWRYDDLDEDTILFVESLEQPVLWWEPQQEADVLGNLEKLLRAKTLIGSADSCGFFVAFRDTTVWRLSNKVQPGELRKFMNVQSAFKYDRETVLRKWKCAVGG